MNAVPASDEEPAELTTCKRLLEAAGRVFAERGFANATVREICAAAGANVAAVNYHFGDKEALYEEVLRHTLELARQNYPIQLDPAAPAAERLRMFIRLFLMRILDRGRPAWHGKLMMREMVEPTGALEMIVATTIRPTWEMLLGVASELCGEGAESARAKLCAMSIIGQCAMHKHCEAVIVKLNPDQRYDSAAIERLAEHVWRFSMAGLRAWETGAERGTESGAASFPKTECGAGRKKAGA